MTPSVVVAGPTSPSTGGDSLQHLNVGLPRTRSVSSSTLSSTSTTGEVIGSPPNNSTLLSVNDSLLAPTQTKSLLWDQAKPHQNLNLPSFNLDLENLTGHNHQQRASVTSLSGVVFDASSGPSNHFFALSQQQLGAGAPLPVVPPTDASNGFSLHQQQLQLQLKYSGVVPPSNKFTQASKSSSVSSASSIVSSSATSFTSYASGATPLIDKEYLASINKVPLLLLRHEILRFSKDQYGCRFLQKKIDENIISNYSIRLANFEIIFKEIHPYLYELIIDPFGNYLIQKLTMYCNESNLNLMMEILQLCLFQISINQHGTRALQKIIDNLSNDYQLSLLIKGLKPYIIELIKDLNGNHVIQKILNKYSPENCQFIYDSIIQDLFPVATHKHGCCVLQKCLNHATHNQLMDFSNAILNYPVSVKLVNDQFGNYVLQYLISIDSIDINYRMFENFIKFGVSELCNLKFSSNVVEKFLKNCYNNELKLMEFSQLKFDLIFNILSGNLNKLINDPYGNYVIQTLLDILVHTQVVYPPDLPGLLALQPDYRYNVNGQMSQSSMQISIIKHWFQNCKIVSSYGKRIQSKINTILNNSNNSSGNTVIGNNHHSMNRNTTHMNNNVAASYNNGNNNNNNNNNNNIPMNMNYLQENMTSTGQFINSNNYYYALQQQPQSHQQQQQQQIHMPQHQLLPNHMQQQQQQFMSAHQFSNGGHPMASRRQNDHQGQRSSQQMPPRMNVQYNYRGMPPQQYMAPYQPNSMMNDSSNKSTINGHSMNGAYGQRYY
ncbi:protein necessary for high temperature growth [Scheffersomyces spartinae]|uniref:Protein necessary for high temperature growth n=1 Tax=Scheffersomyces spartinae TaxID=45513 RepID=A0A9P7VAY0_9ASCO|nr:protein necessary for high temperature growth [Scheffersomyces spartinae]KAG7194448.1 protein necessary for high temperature growth [Scheffersomyces spartinae]